MPAEAISGGSSTYLPNRPSSTTRPSYTSTRPSSLTTQALSVYNRPQWAIGMSADRAAQEALNQQLIRDAIERARQIAEEARRQAEERARQAEQARLAREAERREGALTLGAVPPSQRGIAPAPTVTPMVTQGSYIPNGQRADTALPQAEITTGGMDVFTPGGGATGVTFSDQFRTDNRQLAESIAARRGQEVVELGNGLYGVRPAGMNPTIRGAEGWTQNIWPRIISDRAYRAAQARETSGWDSVTEKAAMESVDWKTLAEAAEGENMDKFWYDYTRAQIGSWGEPEPIYEEVPTGRYEKIYDANGKIIGANEIVEKRIVGWDFDGAGQPEIDPITGRPMDPSKINRPSYLGIDPGYVAVNLPSRPKDNADMEEWKRYYNGLRTAIAPPLYKPEDPIVTLNRMTVKDRAAFQKKLIAAQVVPADETIVPGQMDDVTIGLMAGLMSDANVAGITWERRLDQALEDAALRRARESGGGGYGGGGGGGGTTTYKQIQYSTTSQAQARSMLVGVLTEALGRYPTDDEVAEFLKLLNKQEQKSPSKTVTRTTTEGDMTTAITRMTPSTVDAQALAEEFARGLEGYEDNAVDKYLNALFQGLGEGVV